MSLRATFQIKGSEPVFLLIQVAKPVYLPLEVPDDSLAHPNPPPVVQVHHVTHWLGLSPLVEVV